MENFLMIIGVFLAISLCLNIVTIFDIAKLERRVKKLEEKW